MENKISPVT